MGFVFWTIWWLAGVIGGLLLWRNWKLEFPEEVCRCPTRKGALGIAVYGALGPFGFLVGLIITFCFWVERGFKNGRFAKFNHWWSKPLC